ncbi:LuxR C-terminal-related transcriptional regulator [Escherichia coli]|uniref:LuxR C-terminal-related transcriptional regulator n=1 Tax=Escherichia coli TaxID=562 RepID=UPI0039762F36
MILWSMKKETDIRRGRHCVFLMHVHLVFVTKYRRQIFDHDATEKLRTYFSNVCADFEAELIILTVSDASSDVFALIDAGADGYLLKDSDPEVLLEAIRAGAKGSKVFSERVNQYLREREMFGAEEDPFSVLTERELDVLHELAQGLSNKQIASVLNISEQTVKVHIRNLLRKLNVRSRVAATILFLQQRGAQ